MNEEQSEQQTHTIAFHIILNLSNKKNVEKVNYQLELFLDTLHCSNFIGFQSEKCAKLLFICWVLYKKLENVPELSYRPH